MRIRDHRVTVPVDWEDPASGTLTFFAREVVDPRRDGEDLPLLLFLQGGPGGMSPRPGASGWWRTALERYRLVLLDQRGTGRSSRVDGRVAATFGEGVAGARALADHLAHFRADAIVRDAEHLRRTVYGGRRWTTLGQSYGGFVTLTYLSMHPEALVACLTTGGLPPVGASAERVYAATFPRQAELGGAFARRHPEDVALLGALADRAAAGEVVLPDGDALTPRRVAALGMSLGMSDGASGLHWALDTSGLAETGVPNDAFLAWVAGATGFAANPLYVVMQETIYHEGERAGGWAAQAERERHPGLAEDARPLGLTGEAAFPWMVREIRALRPFAGAAEELAARTSWPALYDAERLAASEVPLAAVQYAADPYVDLDLARATAAGVGAAQVWVTNQYLHDGLRASGEEILPRLWGMADGTGPLPGT